MHLLVCVIFVLVRLIGDLTALNKQLIEFYKFLDPVAINYIVKDQNLKSIKKRLLLTGNPNIILNLLTLFYQLISNQLAAKANILCASVLKQIKEFNLRFEGDKRIVNITSLLLEEFGKRYELVEVNTNRPSTNSTRAK